MSFLKDSKKRQKLAKSTLEAASSLSLGISMVVAVFIGIGIGYVLKKFTGFTPLFWLGVLIGIAAAVLNVYKAYKMQVLSYDEFKKRENFIKQKLKDKAENDK